MRALKNTLKSALCLLGIVLGFLVVMSLITGRMIAEGIDGTAQRAMAQFNGDRVEAMIALVDCRDCSLEERNHAVWALGQIRDKRHCRYSTNTAPENLAIIRGRSARAMEGDVAGKSTSRWDTAAEMSERLQTEDKGLQHE